MRRPRFTDSHLQAKLIELGFKVPMIVIRSWGRCSKYRNDVELWVKTEHGALRGRRLFPQFLAAFDVRIKKHQKEQWL